VFDAQLMPALERIYEDTDAHWEAYHLCEDLVDLETQFQLWRFRHMRTVMRIIGFKPGTGGSSGVGFLKQALELTFFPELFEVRTTIGASDQG
jgi:tryptophan 2,3-dioxygenase